MKIVFFLNLIYKMSIVSCSRTKFNVDDLVYTSCFCMLCFVGLNSVKKSGRNVISPIEQQSTPIPRCYSDDVCVEFCIVLRFA